MVSATLIVGACRRLLSSRYRFFVFWAVCLLCFLRSLRCWSSLRSLSFLRCQRKNPIMILKSSFCQKFFLHLYILWPTWKSKICLEWRIGSWFFGSCWSWYRFQFPPRSNYIMFLDVILNGRFTFSLYMIFGFGWP